MNDLFKNLFTFEMANNHQGSVDHGLKIINAMAKVAKKHHIKAAVKLQYRNLDTFIHPNYRDRDDVKHIPRFISTKLTDKEFLTLITAVQNQGLISMVTPFDEPSVYKCIDHGVQIIKIASCSAHDWPLLETIASTKKPVIASTGGLSIYDIDKVVSFFTHRKVEFALMHCVATYPTLPDTVNMNFLTKMIKRYPCIPVGYSGHEAPNDVDVAKVAVSKGALLLERHVGLPTKTIKLNAYSMSPEQADSWVASAQRAKEICGNSEEKSTSQAEIDSLYSLMRGVYAAGEIKANQAITRNDVFFAMPCVKEQTTSSEFGRYRTAWTASRDYKQNQPIYEHRQPGTIILTRSIIHDAKGMLYEAGVVLGNDIEIELSHHYGLKHFRQTGALIVNVINREYCKKLVVLLPRQEHPNHRHKKKEETFHLLWGDLGIVLNGNAIEMKPGDKLLVERGAWHSFSSQNGAIIEEVSTTHFNGDSYYEDENISRLDPMERKTIIEDW